MYPNIKSLLSREPHLTATVSGILLTVVLFDAGIYLLASAAILIGLLIGRSRVARWKDAFKQFPAALGCYGIVVCLYLFIGTEFAILRKLDPIVMSFLAVFISPLLLVGEWIGWVSKAAKPS